jgi:hypothetical protein
MQEPTTTRLEVRVGLSLVRLYKAQYQQEKSMISENRLPCGSKACHFPLIGAHPTSQHGNQLLTLRTGSDS